MPSTQGLEMLIRQNPLTDQEWFDLIEGRRKLIKPHLDSFTLKELGSLPCLNSEGGSLHELGWDISKTKGDERFSLKTQGIFHRPYSAIERIPIPKAVHNNAPPYWDGGTMQIWGLTRSGLWVLATVNFIDKSGYKDRGRERATDIQIVESDLPTIVAKTKETPRWIWMSLGQTIKEWSEHRRLLHNQALNITRMIEIEELALSLVNQEE